VRELRALIISAVVAFALIEADTVVSGGIPSAFSVLLLAFLPEIGFTIE